MVMETERVLHMQRLHQEVNIHCSLTDCDCAGDGVELGGVGVLTSTGAGSVYTRKVLSGKERAGAKAQQGSKWLASDLAE